MDENKWYEDSEKDDDNTSSYTEDEYIEDEYIIPEAEEGETIDCREEKQKKHMPVWVVSLITSIITSVALFAAVTVLLLPNLKSPTIIHYSSPQGALGENAPNIIPGEFSISDILDKCSPSTVYISSTGIIGGFFDKQVSLGDGSGIIVSSDGYIITSASVVNSGTEIKVTLNDGQVVPAMLVGSDKKTDIAILKIEADSLVPAVLGDSSLLTVGTPILAIGNPLGPQITNTVSYGIISGISNNVSLRKGSSMNLLLTDANINPGNSGGALFNANGEAVGIIISNISSDTDISFSVPINDVKPLLSSYLNINPSGAENGGTPMIGITGSEQPYGVIVESVSENYPAAKADMRVGDLIIKADKIPITTVAQINQIRLSKKRGETIDFTIYRDGEIIDITVTLE